MTNTLATGMIAGFASLMLQVIGVDVIDELVEHDLATGAMPGLTIANYIMFIIGLALVGAFALATVLVLKSPGALLALGFATGIALLAITGVAAFGLYGYPGFQLTPDTTVMLNIIYMAFVLQNPATWLLMFAAFIVIVQVIMNWWWKIE